MDNVINYSQIPSKHQQKIPAQFGSMPALSFPFCDEIGNKILHRLFFYSAIPPPPGRIIRIADNLRANNKCRTST